MPNDLGFLFKKSSLSKVYLNFLVENKNFVNAFKNDKDFIKNSDDLDKKIYQITCDVFFPMKKEYDLKDKRGNKYKNFLKALDNFSFALFNDSSYWKKDYEKYLREGDTNE